MCPVGSQYFRQRRSGYSLIEVIVVLSIVLLLTGFLLTAVQLARESARRASCSNNIKQWVLGTTTYETRKRKLPGSEEVFTFPESVPPQLPPHRPFVIGPWLTVLREMEGSLARYSKINETQQFTDANELVHPSFASCPSDPALRSLAYRFNTGSTGARGAFKKSFNREEPNGPFRSTPFDVTVSEIFDGLSNVAAMSERQGGMKGSKSRYRGMNASFSWVMTVGRIRPDEYETLCHSNGTFEYETVGYKSLPSIKNLDAILYSHVFEPNTQIDDCSASTVDWSISARSHHSGGVNAGFLDGSIHFISNSIDRSLWRELGGISDGGVLQAN